MGNLNFKETELGLIPIDWQVGKINHFLNNSKDSLKIGPFGSQIKKEYLVRNGYKVYGQENVYEKNFKIGSRFINEQKFKELKNYELRPGDIVISMMGTVGKCAIVSNDSKEGIMDSHLIRIRINEELFNKNLLAQLIENSIIIKKQIRKLSVGGIMEGLSSSIIKQIFFPVPPIQEQNKISSILSTVDDLIENTTHLINSYTLLKKGLMQTLLTKGIGHTRFKNTVIGEVPSEWSIKKIIEVAKVVSGGTPNTNKKEYWENGDIAWATPTDITNNKDKYIKETKLNITETGLNESSANLLPIGSILMTSRATIGERCMNLIPMATNQGFKSFVCKDVIYNEYLFYYIDVIKPKLRSLAGGSTFLEISKKDVEDIIIKIPPKLEQKKIVYILMNLDKVIKIDNLIKEKLYLLKKGLMQQLLTGRIRVKV